MKQQTGLPTKITQPFGVNASPALIRAVPNASQIGVTPGAASFNDGFPPLTATALASGGVPPSIQDFNGLLAQMSAWDLWTAAAGITPYDATFQGAIGGYPNGATVYTATAAVLGRVWVSTADNNTTNPDAGGAGWLALMLASDVLALITSNVPTIYAKGSFVGRRVFTASGTYTPLAGATRIRVTVVGAGGGGGGVAATSSSTFGAGGGGGGGGTAISDITNNFASVAMTVGAPGSGGGGSASGGTGGTTSFGAFVSATGGSGGNGSPGGTGGLQAGGSGGYGSGANFQSFVGGAGAYGNANTANNEVSGFGGPSFIGPGASAVYSSTSAGLNGVNYGSGGSGACAQTGAAAQLAGSGAGGVIIVEEYA